MQQRMLYYPATDATLPRNGYHFAMQNSIGYDIKQYRLQGKTVFIAV